ncbi:type I phosphomannose isomerase catalytic subunit [Lacrimispora brassicae]
MKLKIERPLAITMWDFSWLERRWDGAGYEDWDLVLDELKGRGYDAVRIDAYPHLLTKEEQDEWILYPEWSQQTWGAPAVTRISDIRGNLIEFMNKCRERGIYVALSTWFREDADNIRLEIDSPAKLALIWEKTISILESAGLMDTILYVDLCNEFPAPPWTGFLYERMDEKSIPRYHKESLRWMKEAIGIIKNKYPSLCYTVSSDGRYDSSINKDIVTTENYRLDREDVSFQDFIELHLWFVQFCDFYETIGYEYDRFIPDSFNRLAEKGEAYYRSKTEFFNTRLKEGIVMVAEWAKKNHKPLISTECWGPVDYKDWPLLDWGWVKELCETGTIAASETGQWAAIATSNFCGPQFVGMWRDTEWHKRLTDIIHKGKLPDMEANVKDSNPAPIKLSNERVWRTYLGGSMLDMLHGFNGKEDGHFPEEWIASLTAARNAGREKYTEEGLSKLASHPSKYLKDVIEADPQRYLGKPHVEAAGASLGVLVKLIDSSERLGIQVHPDRVQAKKLFNSDYGKTECWHILGGREINGEAPHIYVGFKEGVTRELWQELFEKQDIEGMLSSMHRYDVAPGDTVLIDGGVPHAIGSGCFLIEIQEPTDYTIRVERITPSGLKVEDSMCHQGIGFDRMFECFNYETLNRDETYKRRFIQTKCLYESSGGQINSLISYQDTPFFKMEELEIKERLDVIQEDSFAILYVIDGSGTFKTDSDKLQLQKGEQYFLPIGVGKMELQNDLKESDELKILYCFGPEVKNKKLLKAKNPGI